MRTWPIRQCHSTDIIGWEIEQWAHAHAHKYHKLKSADKTRFIYVLDISIMLNNQKCIVWYRTDLNHWSWFKSTLIHWCLCVVSMQCLLVCLLVVDCQLNKMHIVKNLILLIRQINVSESDLSVYSIGSIWNSESMQDSASFYRLFFDHRGNIAEIYLMDAGLASLNWHFGSKLAPMVRPVSRVCKRICMICSSENYFDPTT